MGRVLALQHKYFLNWLPGLQPDIIDITLLHKDILLLASLLGFLATASLAAFLPDLVVAAGAIMAEAGH